MWGSIYTTYVCMDDFLWRFFRLGGTCDNLVVFRIHAVRRLCYGGHINDAMNLTVDIVRKVCELYVLGVYVVQRRATPRHIIQVWICHKHRFYNASNLSQNL